MLQNIQTQPGMRGQCQDDFFSNLKYNFLPAESVKQTEATTPADRPAEERPP